MPSSVTNWIVGDVVSLVAASPDDVPVDGFFGRELGGAVVPAREQARLVLVQEPGADQVLRFLRFCFQGVGEAVGDPSVSVLSGDELWEMADAVGRLSATQMPCRRQS